MQTDVRTVQALADVFFDVIPHSFNQHCSLTARIAYTSLRHFGIEAELFPCQLWHASPERSIVNGFTGRKTELPGKWDGHIICRAGDWYIDAATAVFRNEFTMEVPSVATFQVLPVPSAVIGRLDLNATNTLWWFVPPQGINVTPPDDPVELVDQLASALIEKVDDAIHARPSH